MTFETRFVNEAVTELDEAIGWYDDRRAGLGLAFLVAVDRTIKFVAQFPQKCRGSLMVMLPSSRFGWLRWTGPVLRRLSH